MSFILDFQLMQMAADDGWVNFVPGNDPMTPSDLDYAAESKRSSWLRLHLSVCSLFIPDNLDVFMTVLQII